MIRSVPRVSWYTLILLAVSGALSHVGAQFLFTKDLCGPGAGQIGNNWTSLPTDSDIARAEDFCTAIPAAVTVSQFKVVGGTFHRWTYDCTTGICSSTTGVVPEPSCSASACFCVDDGEGFEIRPSVATRFDINGCDSFVPITLPSGFNRYLISVPFDTFLVTANDLARHIGLPTGLGGGTVTRLDCQTGVFFVCSAGAAPCDTLVLRPGEAYQVAFPSTAGTTYLNPVSCNAPRPAADACPIDSLNFTDTSNMAWGAPAGCPLPLLYDAARGELSCLRNACAQPAARSCPSCVGLENNDIDTTAADPASPVEGQGYWYLVRVDGGTWNGPGTTQCVDRDFLLGAGCP